MSERKILSLVHYVDDDNRKMMLETAERLGFSVSFFNTFEEAAAEAKDAEVVYTSDPRMIEKAENMKWLCTSTAGVDAFLSAGMAERPDVLFTNAAGAYGVTISEHIVMTALMMMRRMPEYEERVRRKDWRKGLSQSSIFGSKVLIIGTGNIGKTAAERIRGFCPKEIVGVNRSGRAVEGFEKVVPSTDLAAVIPEADLVICCVPGTPETKAMIDSDIIGRMKETAYFINVGRGTAVDVDALAEALKEGRIAGAALDVFPVEPLSPEDPVWDTPRLLITPHVAGNDTVKETRRLNVAMFCEDLENYAMGRPLIHTVDRKLGY